MKNKIPFTQEMAIAISEANDSVRGKSNCADYKTFEEVKYAGTKKWCEIGWWLPGVDDCYWEYIASAYLKANKRTGAYTYGNNYYLYVYIELSNGDMYRYEVCRKLAELLSEKFGIDISCEKGIVA